MDLSILFEPARLIFTIPMLVSFAFGALALVGLFDFDGLDLDLDADADVDLDAGVDIDADVDLDADLDADADAGNSGGSFLQLLGLGYVPITLSIVLLGFTFGWTGHLLTSLFGSSVAATVGSGLATTGVLAVPAVVAAVGITAPLSRLFAPLFRDYGKATQTHELVGKTAVLTTGSVSPSFGSASVRVPGRGPIDISVRVDPSDVEKADALKYGERVLIYDYDSDKGVYFVAPHASEDR
ncbi:hypothetical protein CRI94_09885 [Longibacter salinarum]|uniref:DUF1449 domain-containing protein n=1 Tax=Longibacter salinarum TaxID=1850348 RepID=A0A2A8CYY0_9BACT|nr:OB-fold-containig protein [Longibacter salinarum]PEN13608.1 hypothetical protein CRI94_09885 [Longibacter salinarum]